MTVKKVLSAFTAAALSAVMLTSCGKDSGESGYNHKDDGKMRSITSAELVKDMGLGWNLGNTLDVCSADRDNDGVINETADKVDETLWGNPKADKKLFESLADDGIKSVRIPVTWRDHMASGAPDYDIDEDWMDRVEEVVGYAISCNMYVIINLHHDGGDDTDFGAWIKNADEDYNGVLERYKAVWSQIAERFKDYSDYLVFESMNEVGFDDISPSEGYEIVNNLNQEFVNLIRSSGGNNAKRHLLIAGYWTDITKSCEGTAMPDDPENRCILSVHYYTPWQFCINGSPSEWGTDLEVNELDRLFSLLDETFIQKGVPVILGEYGVNSAAEDDSRIYWCESVVKRCTDLGVATFFWDNGEEVDRATYEWRTAGLLDALKRASSGEDYTPEKPKVTINEDAKMIQMPDAVGQNIDEFKEIYGSFLDIEVIEKEDASEESGVIIDQDAIVGAFTEKGSKVKLTVSK